MVCDLLFDHRPETVEKVDYGQTIDQQTVFISLFIDHR